MKELDILLSSVNLELWLRLCIFFAVFYLILLWESYSPNRKLHYSKLRRWKDNFSLLIINSLALRIILPMGTLGVALFVEEKSWGLFNHLKINQFLAVILSVIILDLVIFLQHRVFHAIPMLWRLHRVHHTDLDYDLTTGFRFHLIEILISMFVKIIAICFIGPPVIAILIFEIVLNAMAMFNHGNIKLRGKLDTVLRMLIVTPDMHNIHHSIKNDETNSNFGFNLSLWDKIFGTYRVKAKLKTEKIQFGVQGFETENKCMHLLTLLKQPSKK